MTHLPFSSQPVSAGRTNGPLELAPSMTLGATSLPGDRTYFRVWAPRRQRVEVEVACGDGPRRMALKRGTAGYFCGEFAGIPAGSRYRYVLDQHLPRPDPASRYQPDGPHGWSEVTDPTAYDWRDDDWRGVSTSALLIYELHIGTFTPAGTFAAAAERLAELRELGINAVELMPLAQTPGRWNWGYDGVGLFAVRNTYGRPDDFRRFVDACHAHGIAVLVDVVYNHLGPEGNYFHDFGPYFSRRHGTPWGPAWNFDGPRRGPVRDVILQNVAYWLREYHVDGLRLDAIHFMFDESRPTIVGQIAQTVDQLRSEFPWTLHLIAETNVYDRQLLSPAADTQASYDAIWCDDFLHSVQSVATRGRHLTHRDYLGARDLAEVLQHGFLYTSPSYQRVPHDEPRDSRHTSGLVFSLQNHDVIGNHPDGDRLHHLTSAEFQRAAAALLLLYPAIPMLFMGEEYLSDARFLFFVDFGDERLRRAVVRGRRDEHPQHQWHDAVSPVSEEAFVRSRPGSLTSGDRTTWLWYQQLIGLRKQWLDQGLLNAENMRVVAEPQAQFFQLQYTAGQQQAFVAVRLLAAGERPVPLQVAVAGEVVAASPESPADRVDAQRRDDGWRPLPVNRALVGYGTLRYQLDDPSATSSWT